jgi:hypothetical protein
MERSIGLVMQDGRAAEFRNEYENVSEGYSGRISGKEN